MFLLAAPNGNDYDMLGAGFLVQTKDGVKLVTDASVVRDRNKIYAFAHPASDGVLGRPIPVVIERASSGIGPAIGSLSTDAPALTLAQAAPATDDLVRSIGPLRIAGPWTTTQGLVTQVGDATFQSDAVLSAEMAGSPVINDRGEVAGLMVRRGEDVAALRPEKIREFLDGGSEEISGAGFIASRNSGSASLLSTARPVDEYTWTAPGASAIETGLPGDTGGVNWDGYIGAGGYGATGYAGPPSGYSSGYSPGYSSDGAADLGTALGNLAAKLAILGLQKLFGGIYALFHQQPGTAQRSRVIVTKVAPPPPPPEPKITGLVLSAEPADALPGESVMLVGQLRFQGDYKNKANIGVSLSVPADGRAIFADGKTSISATTDGAGRAFAALTIVQKTEDSARDAFAELDARARGTAVEASPAARAEATPKRKAEDAAISAQDDLDAEGGRAEPGDAAEAGPSEETGAPDRAPPVAPPIEVTAASSGFSDVAEIKAPVKLYYTEAMSAERMADGTVTVSARILTNDKSFDVSDLKVAFDATSAECQKPDFAAITDRGGAARLDVRFPGASALASLPLEDAALAQPVQAGSAADSGTANPICTVLGGATTVGLCATAVLAPASGPAAPVTMGIVIIGAGIGGKFISDRCGAIADILSRASKPQPMPADGGNDGGPAGGKKDDALIGQPGDPNQHGPREERAPLNRKFSDKIKQQMNDPRRNWSEKEIEDAFNNPRATESSTVKSNGNPATRYFNRSGKFIVVDDVTGEVIQVGGIDFAENLPPLP
ncbi:MAG TPA: colicin E5-related ribonuclease [Elusimicrobiota bacterium]|nr:colicin E5-related ribonuclease [Elusimicrobiota bacterium]